MHFITLSLLILPFSIAAWNYFRFARIRSNDSPTREIPVSVLVPARNEERSIEECVRSLLDQSYGCYEVIVLDDSSEDRTGEILGSITDPRLRVIAGEPLPPGWTGKNRACHRLAEHASGELLIFTDADTIHRDSSVRSCVAFAERSGCGLFSGVPRQRMPTFLERVIVPMPQFLYFAFLPNEWITSKTDERFSATNGQLLCVTREAYDRIGGHNAVRSSILEDVELGRAAKRAGIRTALATAVETVDCRMYRSSKEIIEGFSKNLYPGLGASPVGLLLFIATMLLLFVYPPVAIVASIARGDWSTESLLLPLLSLLMGAGIRLMIALRFSMPLDQILYQPLGALGAAAIALNSARMYHFSNGPTWKGRRVG
jgi:chlorobactene glucosyltransferase